jgi:hypothetical protein
MATWRRSSKNTGKIILIPIFNKTLPRAHTESKLDMLGVHKKLVKYVVHSSKRKNWKKNIFLHTSCPNSNRPNSNRPREGHLVCILDRYIFIFLQFQDKHSEHGLDVCPLLKHCQSVINSFNLKSCTHYISVLTRTSYISTLYKTSRVPLKTGDFHKITKT